MLAVDLSEASEASLELSVSLEELLELSEVLEEPLRPTAEAARWLKLWELSEVSSEEDMLTVDFVD